MESQVPGRHYIPARHQTHEGRYRNIRAGQTISVFEDARAAQQCDEERLGTGGLERLEKELDLDPAAAEQALIFFESLKREGFDVLSVDSWRHGREERMTDSQTSLESAKLMMQDAYNVLAAVVKQDVALKQRAEVARRRARPRCQTGEEDEDNEAPISNENPYQYLLGRQLDLDASDHLHLLESLSSEESDEGQDGRKQVEGSGPGSNDPKTKAARRLHKRRLELFATGAGTLNFCRTGLNVCGAGASTGVELVRGLTFAGAGAEEAFVKEMIRLQQRLEAFQLCGGAMQRPRKRDAVKHVLKMGAEGLLGGET